MCYSCGLGAYLPNLERQLGQRLLAPIDVLRRPRVELREVRHRFVQLRLLPDLGFDDKRLGQNLHSLYAGVFSISVPLWISTY